MDAPGTVFLDTSIFRGAGFNFDAARLAGLIELTQFQEIKLLLPNATLREIERHILKGLADAESAMRKAFSKAPLSKHFLEFNWIHKLEYDQEKARNKAWEDFGRFTSRFHQICQIDYEHLNIHEVQDWRSNFDAPFSVQKPNEYSYAIALSVILGYAEAHDERVAIISEDKDWSLACERYSQLEYYSNALAYSEHRDPNVKLYSDLKQYLRTDGKFKVLLANTLFKTF